MIRSGRLSVFFQQIQSCRKFVLFDRASLLHVRTDKLATYVQCNNYQLRKPALPDGIFKKNVKKTTTKNAKKTPVVLLGVWSVFYCIFIYKFFSYFFPCFFSNFFPCFFFFSKWLVDSCAGGSIPLILIINIIKISGPSVRLSIYLSVYSSAQIDSAILNPRYI